MVTAAGYNSLNSGMQRSIFSNIEALAGGGSGSVLAGQNNQSFNTGHFSPMLSQYAAMFGLPGNTNDYYAQMPFMDPRHLWMMNPNYHQVLQQYQQQTAPAHQTHPVNLHEKHERKSEELDFVACKTDLKGI